MTSDDISCLFTNPDGGQLRPVLVETPSLDIYDDRPRKLQIKVEKNHGVLVSATVQATRKGAILLLGHVDKIDDTKLDYDVITCASAEAQLEDRIGFWYRYPAGTTLNTMLADSPGGSVVGLLAIANHMIPQGMWELYAGAVWRIKADINSLRGGTSSRFGAITAIYQGVTLLTHGASSALSAGQWFQDATDLYIRCLSDRDPKVCLILASPSWKDTLVRKGTIESGTSALPVPFEISPAKLWPQIQALLLARGLEWTVDGNKDGYAYLNAAVAVGKGSATAPLATFIEDENAQITAQPITGNSIACLCGQGAGAGPTQQAAAAFNLSLGTWREAVYSGSGMFSTLLSAAVTKIFNEKANNIAYVIKPYDPVWGMNLGDWVCIKRNGYQPTYQRLKQISQKDATSLQAGARVKDIVDLLKGEQDVQRILQSFYGSHTKNAWTWSFPAENIDSFTGISHTFLLASTDDSTKNPDDKTLGAGEIDPNFPFTVLLNLKIGWYTSSLYSSTVNTDSHGNVGSHGGYGGGSTSAKTQTGHGVPQVTGYPQSGYSVSVCNATAISYSSSTASGGSYGSASTGYANPGPHAHSYFAPANHAHGFSFYYALPYIMSDPAGHVHIMPGHYTYDAGSQSHETAHEASQTRGGSSAHPLRETILAGLKKQYPTGSLKYLSLAVQVNGVAAPGSPFTDLYIGDGITNVDISSLVTVGQNNVITYALTEWGGSDPVKCSISGNINVNAIISAF